MTVRAIVAGHLCLDITPRFLSDRMPGPGQLAVVGPTMFSTGGVVSNTGLSLLRMGIATRLRGKLGADFFGSAVREIVERHTTGSSESLIVSERDATSYTLVLSPTGKDRSFIHCPGANDAFGPADVPDDMLEATDLLHFGYPPLMRQFFRDGGRGLVELLQRCQKAGLTTSLDMSVIDPTSEAASEEWPAIMRSVLPFVDIFVPSVGEMRAIWDRSVLERQQSLDAALPRLAQRALSEGARVVMIKASTRGVYLRSGAQPMRGRAAPDSSGWGERELWAPALKPDEVVTANGAGDAAVAGFLAALLRNQPPELALTVACAAGACCCEQADATSGVRSWDETLARLGAGWTRVGLTPALPGWRWDEQATIWRGPHDR